MKKTFFCLRNTFYSSICLKLKKMKPNPKPTRLSLSSTSPPSPVSPLCAAAHGLDPAGSSLAPSTEICSKLHIQATHQFDLVLSTHKFKQIAYEKTTTTTTSLYVQLLYDVPCTVLVFPNFPACNFQSGFVLHWLDWKWEKLTVCTSNILVIHYYSSGSPPSSYTTHNT